MRGALVLLIIIGSLPFCLTRPWIGVLVFSWISYMNPHRYTWGIARSFPIAMIVALVTLFGLIATKDRARLPRDPATILIALLWLLFGLTTCLAINQADAWSQLDRVSKILLMTFVTIVLINTKEKLRMLLLVIALSVGLIGLKGGIWAIASGGSNRVYGPDGSFLADNNDLALGLNMTLPLLFYLAKDEPRKWLRWALRATFVGSVVAIVFTYSRGGFLALALVGGMLLIKARYKVLAVIMMFAAVMALTFIVPEKWTARMDTINAEAGEQDASAHGRINAWRTAWNLAIDRPLTGGGFETFTPAVYDRYSPEPWNVRDVHSNYFEMLGEQGFIGLGLYMMLLFYCLITLSRLKSWVARNPQFSWARHYPDMLQVAVLAYMLGGTFLGRAYFDLFYQLVATIVILRMVMAQTLASIETEPVPAHTFQYLGSTFNASKQET